MLRCDYLPKLNHISIKGLQVSANVRQVKFALGGHLARRQWADLPYNAS